MRLMSRPSIELLITLLCCATAALAQDAAKLVPADAAVFIEINDLAGLRKDWVNDPLARFLRDNLPVESDAGFDEVQKVMGLSAEEIIDRFFGTSVALVVMKPGDQEPGLLISKMSDADAALAIQKLQLKADGTFGADGKQFRGFTSPDGKANIAIGQGWAVVSQPRYSDAARAVLEGRGKTLADHAAFKAWTARLPAGQRVATVFVHPAQSQVHVLGVYRKGRDLTVQYRGKSPELDGLASTLGGGKALDFGPLPASTIAAVTVNLQPPAEADAKYLDRLFPGKTFRADIQPKLAAPTVLFLGEVPGDRLNPDPGLSVPVGGFAIRLANPAVAADLTKAIDGLMIVANFAAAKWQVPPIEVKELKHGDATFRSANIGAALAQRAGRDEFKPITLTYGRVGQWYVVCTQDAFFTQCVDAETDPAQRFAGSKSVAAMPLKDHEAPIATAVLRPSALAAHVQTWLNHWSQQRPEVVKSSHQTNPPTPEAQLVRGARIAAGLLDYYQSMSLQAYRDGDAIAAQADIVRK
jgi:hypothetical protein